jgi:hyperosmotically inducible periplasmic protein
MKLTKLLSAAAIAAVVAFSVPACKSGPKDAEIKTAVEAAVKDVKGLVVDVKDGVVTMSGECKDDGCKTGCETAVKGIKGVKSVTNNCTVAPPPPPPPASLTTTMDAATQQKVKDGLKDMKGITVTFEGEKAVLAGEVTKADRMKVMQMLMSAKAKYDVSKLMDKK